MTTQPLIYRIGYWFGTALQFVGYALVVFGTVLCGGNDSGLPHEEDAK